MTDERIWIGRDGQQYGPYDEASVRQWLREGKLTPDTLAWRDGMGEWAPLASLFPEHAESAPPPFATVPPPPPVGTGAGAASASFSARGHASAGQAADRAALPRPPSLHWGLVWLFSVLTLGIFAIIWPFIQAGWVRKIDRASNATLLMGLAMACLVIGYVLYFAGIAALAHGGGGIAGFGALALLAGWVLYLVAYFSMAGSMRDKLASRELPLDIGGVTLFFFTMYYLQAQLSWLARWKRTGQTLPRASKGVFWGIFCIVPFVIAILAAISIPAYQDYLIRAQVAEGVVLADGAKTAVAGYYQTNQAMPTDNPSAGLAPSDSIRGRYVSGVDVSGGTITVAYGGAGSNIRIRNDVLVLTPFRDGTGKLGWRCPGAGTTVPERYLPLSCRQR